MKIESVVTTNTSIIETCVVNHFKSLFNKYNILQGNGLVEEKISNLVSEQDNTHLTRIPSPFEIKEVMMSLKRDNVPGPNGFREIFFQIYRDIIGKDGINVVTQFFMNDWILPH